MTLTYSLDVVQILTLLSGTILPILVGLVTTRVTAPGVKGVLLASLSAVAALVGEALTAAQAGTPYDLGRGIVMALGVWCVATATHFGLWKPTGAADTVADTGRTATPADDDAVLTIGKDA